MSARPRKNTGSHASGAAGDRENLNFGVAPALKERMAAEAARCRLSLSEWVRLCCEVALERGENPYIALVNIEEGKKR